MVEGKVTDDENLVHFVRTPYVETKYLFRIEKLAVFSAACKKKIRIVAFRSQKTTERLGSSSIKSMNSCGGNITKFDQVNVDIFLFNVHIFVHVYFLSRVVPIDRGNDAAVQNEK